MKLDDADRSPTLSTVAPIRRVTFLAAVDADCPTSSCEVNMTSTWLTRPSPSAVGTTDTAGAPPPAAVTADPAAASVVVESTMKLPDGPGNV